MDPTSLAHSKAPRPASRTIVRAFNPPALETPSPVFAHVSLAPLSASVTQFIIAGQIGTDPETQETPPDLASQVDICLRRISICLDAANATTNDMTRFMYYIAERGFEGDKTIEMLLEKVTKWLGPDARPTSCFLVPKSLSQPKFLCEFEAMGVVANEGAEDLPRAQPVLSADDWAKTTSYSGYYGGDEGKGR